MYDPPKAGLFFLVINDLPKMGMEVFLVSNLYGIYNRSPICYNDFPFTPS